MSVAATDNPLVAHCEHLLRSSADAATLAKANDSKQLAERELACLNRNAQARSVRK
jgi:hypothetical protein